MDVINTISTDKHNSFDIIMTVFENWNRSCSSPYTWEVLLDALESPSVDDRRLAEELRQKFCK